MSKIVEAARLLIARFYKADIPTRAAALAFHSLLGIVPILGLSFWYLTELGITEKWKNLFENFVLSHLDVGSSQNFIGRFEHLTDSVGGKSAGLIGLGILIYTAFNLIVKFGNAVDEILNATHEEPSLDPAFFALVLRRGFFMMGLPVALFLSIAVTSWLKTDSWFRYIFRLKTVGTFFAMPIPWIVDIFTIALIYHFIPKRAVPWREALKAACVAGPVLEGAKMLVGVYSHHAIRVQKLYGALAAIPLLMLWVQVGWMIVLGGALLIRIKKVPHIPSTNFTSL